MLGGEGLLEQQPREFGQVRKPDTWLRSLDWRVSEFNAAEEKRLIEKYGPKLGVAIFDFRLAPDEDRIRILAEQVVIKSEQGTQEDRTLALAALLEAVTLRAHRNKFH